MHSVFLGDVISAFAGDAMLDFALLCRLKDEDEDANVDGSGLKYKTIAELKAEEAQRRAGTGRIFSMSYISGDAGLPFTLSQAEYIAEMVRMGHLHQGLNYAGTLYLHQDPLSASICVQCG